MSSVRRNPLVKFWSSGACIMASITKRGNVWRVRITRLGHETVSKTFRLKADAEKFASAVEGEMARGTYRRNPGAKVTLGELLQRYGDEVTPHKRGADVERYRIASLQTRDNPAHKMMVKFVGDLTAADVAAWRDKRVKSCTPSTIQKEFALLQHCVKTAAAEWGFEGMTNPFQGVRRPRVQNARDRRVSDGEIRAIIEATESAELASLVRLALATAARRGELLSLTWRDVDLTRRVAVLRAANTKNGHARQLPLSPAACDVLRSLPRLINGGCLFSLQPHSVTQAFNRAVDRARARYVAAGGTDPHHLTGLRFHDLRHEACTRLAELGLSAFELSAVSGHRTLQLAARYTHLQADKMADRLAAAVA